MDAFVLLIVLTWAVPIGLGVLAGVLWVQHREAPSRPLAMGTIAVLLGYTGLCGLLAATFIAESWGSGSEEWPAALFCALTALGVAGLWSMRDPFLEALYGPGFPGDDP